MASASITCAAKPPRENGLLKKLVAEQALDNDILREAARRNF